MPKNTFNNFFVSELQRLYGQEKKLTRVLARFGEAAKAPDLKSSFARELREAETHINRLEEVFQAVGQKPAARSCPRVDGMFEECDRVADLAAEPAVHDVALLAAGQHFLHDEIAGYGCIRAWAQLLGKTHEADVLQKSLDEKKRMDEDWTRLSKAVNKEAVTLIT